MTMFAKHFAARPMVLRLSTAAELMTASPLSLNQSTPIAKAAALLEFNDLAAAPVIDAHDRPIGVITREACAAWQEFCVRSSPHGFVSEDLDATPVAEIMSPVILTAHELDSSRLVIDKLLAERSRRVLIVNDEGQLVGVVSTSDVLRHLLSGETRRRKLGAGASLLC